MITRESKRIAIETQLADYYRNKFAEQTGRKPDEYTGVWVAWDSDKRAYKLRGEGLPAHPDLVAQSPNGWSLLDYIKPAKANKLLGIAKPEPKRIDTVTVRRVADYDADTSHLGELADQPGEYAIVHVGEHSGMFVDQLPCECGHREAQHGDDDECSECPDECNYFDRVEVSRGREYRYFNPPSDNYKGCSDAEIRDYCQQDYQRMRGLLNNQWGYVGITADARILIADGGVTSNGRTFTTQTIQSGGLWGIETDSGDDYFTEIESEQLAELKTQLHALGFSKRAITAAFREVEYKDE